MDQFDNKNVLLELLRKYAEGKITPEEKAFVEAWYDQFEQQAEFLDTKDEQFGEVLGQTMKDVLVEEMSQPSIRPIGQLMQKMGLVAASIVIGLFSLWYFFDRSVSPGPAETITANTMDIAPGGDKAILYLGDGSIVPLDNLSLGIVAKQGNTSIYKSEEGMVTYVPQGGESQIAINTIVAPAAGKYKVILSDGSTAWLNSESSITFPTNFMSSTREVKITGEVYFDIKRDIKRPFLVKTGTIQTVKVLGTKFNINAYSDKEPIKTTLLEGSVQVVLPGRDQLRNTIMLKPGEQSMILPNGSMDIKKNVNLEEVIAWKNGFFQFEKADIKQVMEQLGRWYNVEVLVDRELPIKSFTGKISHEMTAVEAFEVLRFTGLNFAIKELPSERQKGKIVITH